METCPSGQLLEIDCADRHAIGVGAARRSEAGALPVVDPYRFGDRGPNRRPVARGRGSEPMAHDHLDEATARRLQCESDRARDAYARYLYGTEMTDASHFHLVIDTTAIDIDACVDLLETWARRWRPVGVSHPTSSG